MRRGNKETQTQTQSIKAKKHITWPSERASAAQSSNSLLVCVSSFDFSCYLPQWLCHLFFLSGNWHFSLAPGKILKCWEDFKIHESVWFPEQGNLSACEDQQFFYVFYYIIEWVRHAKFNYIIYEFHQLTQFHFYVCTSRRPPKCSCDFASAEKISSKSFHIKMRMKQPKELTGEWMLNIIPSGVTLNASHDTSILPLCHMRCNFS